MVLKIGDGHMTRFWEDSWLEEDSLASLFPRLFNNSLQEGECIEKMGRWSMSYDKSAGIKESNGYKNK